MLPNTLEVNIYNQGCGSDLQEKAQPGSVFGSKKKSDPDQTLGKTGSGPNSGKKTGSGSDLFVSLR